MATNVPSCFLIQFLELLLKFLVNFTLLKLVKSQRNYGFFITEELIFWLPDFGIYFHFSAYLKCVSLPQVNLLLSAHNLSVVSVCVCQRAHKIVFRRIY